MGGKGAKQTKLNKQGPACAEWCASLYWLAKYRPPPILEKVGEGRRHLSKDCLTRTFNKSPPLLKPYSGTPQASGQWPLSIASNCDGALLSYPTPTTTTGNTCCGVSK